MRNRESQTVSRKARFRHARSDENRALLAQDRGAAARQRSSVLLMVAILVVPGVMGGLGSPLLEWAGNGGGEIAVGIFFVTAVSIAVVAGLWIHGEPPRRASNQRATQGLTDSVEGASALGNASRGWVRVPIEDQALTTGLSMMSERDNRTGPTSSSQQDSAPVPPESRRTTD